VVRIRHDGRQNHSDSHRDGDIQMSGEEISEKKRLQMIILALGLKVKRNKI